MKIKKYQKPAGVLPEFGEIKEYKNPNPINEFLKQKIDNNQTLSQLKRGFYNFNNSALGTVAKILIPTNMQSAIAPPIKSVKLIKNAEKYHGLGKQTEQLLKDISTVGMPEGRSLSRLKNLLDRLNWNSGKTFNRQFFNTTFQHYRTAAEKVEKATEEASRINQKYNISNSSKIKIEPSSKDRIQKIVDSDFTPFDEIKLPRQVGAKARTTENSFRLSDYRKNGGIITKELDILKKYQQGGILKAQNGIKYTPTNSNTELPEIEGYKPQFSNFWYGGDETKKEESVPVQEEPIQETPIQVETPVQSEWSDIKSMIKKHEGFTSRAKRSFGEPNPTVGYGFFNVLPDGRKVTDNMTITEDEADKQLDIAIDKLRKNISSAVSSYNMKISDNQLNVLIDLGYHGGAGLVSSLLREANGDTSKIPTLLARYATKAKYGDTSIAKGLRDRAKRRVEGWNKG